jgi:hypothetical protein
VRNPPLPLLLIGERRSTANQTGGPKASTG